MNIQRDVAEMAHENAPSLSPDVGGNDFWSSRDEGFGSVFIDVNFPTILSVLIPGDN